MKADTYVPWAACIVSISFITGINVGLSDDSILDSLNAFSSLLLSISTAIIALAAWRGVNQWRKELRGKSDYDMALEVLKKSISLRDVVQASRNPITPELSALDLIQAIPNQDESAYENNLRQVKPHQNAWRNRADRVFARLRELEECYVEIEIFFGAECKDLAVDMSKRVQNYLTAIDWEIGNLGRGDSTPDDLRNKAVLLRSLVGGPDDYTLGIEKDVERIKIFLDSYIRKKSD